MEAVEVHKLYGLAMGCDSRLESPLTNEQAEIWAFILADVPYVEAADILRRLYSSHQTSVLQPGDVKEAWESVKADREKTIDAIRRTDRYMSSWGCEDPEEIRERKWDYRQSLVESLPDRVRAELMLPDRKAIEAKSDTFMRQMGLEPRVESARSERKPPPETIRDAVGRIGRF